MTLIALRDRCLYWSTVNRLVAAIWKIFIGLAVCLRCFKAMESQLDLTTVGVTGQRLADLLDATDAPGAWQTTIRSLDEPLGPAASLVVLKGSQRRTEPCSSAHGFPHLHKHRGRAFVFEAPEDVARGSMIPRWA